METPRTRAPAVMATTIASSTPQEAKPKPKIMFLPKFLVTGENRKLFIDWFSGLVSGFVSVTICAPLDLARTRHMLLATTNSYGQVTYKGFFHTAATIAKQEGIQGLYKGYNVTAVSIPLFHSLYFSIFYKAKRYLNENWIPETQPLLTNIIAAVSTGFICDTLTCPLWVVRTRIQAQHLHRGSVPKYTGLIDGLTQMYKQEGLKSFYKGLFTSYVGLSHAAILYPLYEYLKTKLKAWKGDLSSLDIFCVSLTSKFVAMVVTYPHVVIRTRQQDQRTPLAGQARGTSFVTMIKQTVQREGIKGLYAGLRIDLIRVLPANAITFITFEYVKKNLQEALPEY